MGSGVGNGAGGGWGCGTWDGSGAGDGGVGMGGIHSGEGDGEGNSVGMWVGFMGPFFRLPGKRSVLWRTTEPQRSGSAVFVPNRRAQPCGQDPEQVWKPAPAVAWRRVLKI